MNDVPWGALVIYAVLTLGSMVVAPILLLGLALLVGLIGSFIGPPD
jgi:hypothetical protein